MASLSLAQETSDIEASRPFSGDAASIVQRLSNPEQFALVLPEDCARKWSSDGVGIGSRFQVTYTMGWWKRRLEATVTRANTEQGVEWDHHGNKGFITRWTFDEGTIRVKTWIQAPPWPFKRAYFKRIKPRWELCYRRALDTLVEGAVDGADPN